VVPLRPLTLGDIFGGALQTIRRNPGATVGLAALVTFAFMVVPIVATVALGASGSLAAADPFDVDSSADSPVAAADVVGYVSTAAGAVFSLLAGIVVTGLIVRVAEHAVLGRRISMGEAWARSRGRLLPLLGLTLVIALMMAVVLAVPLGVGVGLGYALGAGTLPIVLLGVLGGLVGVVGMVLVYVRWALLAAPALVLEGVGVLASLRRGRELSRGEFWRLLGIYLLASIAAGFVSQVIAIPLAVIGVVLSLVVPSGWAVPVTLLSSHLATVLTGAVVGPFSSGVPAMQYFDQRFRKEGLDIELLNRALGTGGGPR
jgi:hypothetical protein